MKDPLSEKETFLRFIARFWELEESSICEDGHWSYYDKGTKMLVSVKPVESETFDNGYLIRIIDRMNDEEDSE